MTDEATTEGWKVGEKCRRCEYPRWSLIHDPPDGWGKTEEAHPFEPIPYEPAPVEAIVDEWERLEGISLRDGPRSTLERLIREALDTERKNEFERLYQKLVNAISADIAGDFDAALEQHAYNHQEEGRRKERRRAQALAVSIADDYDSRALKVMHPSTQTRLLDHSIGARAVYASLRGESNALSSEGQKGGR